VRIHGHRDQCHWPWPTTQICVPVISHLRTLLVHIHAHIYIHAHTAWPCSRAHPLAAVRLTHTHMQIYAHSLFYTHTQHDHDQERIDVVVVRDTHTHTYAHPLSLTSTHSMTVISSASTYCSQRHTHAYTYICTLSHTHTHINAYTQRDRDQQRINVLQSEIEKGKQSKVEFLKSRLTTESTIQYGWSANFWEMSSVGFAAQNERGWDQVPRMAGETSPWGAIQRALYTPKRALYTPKGAVLERHHREVHSKEPYTHLQKTPCTHLKNPVHTA